MIGKGPKNTLNILSRVLDSKLELPNICALLQIVLVLPVSTADPEWRFSVMKRIKTDWRCSLTPK